MATNLSTATFIAVSATVTHINRAKTATSFTPFVALKVVPAASAPSPAALCSVVVGPAGDASVAADLSARPLDLPLTAIIRAFRAQLAAQAPDHACRKWSLFCGFEGFLPSLLKGGGAAPSRQALRRAIPLFQVALSPDVTAATPQMTPAASRDYQDATVCAATLSEEHLAPAVTPASTTLSQLLAPFVAAEDSGRLLWEAKLSFIVGEDEEEERKRRREEAEQRAAAAAKEQLLALQHAASSQQQAQPGDGIPPPPFLHGGGLFSTFGASGPPTGSMFGAPSSSGFGAAPVGLFGGASPKLPTSDFRLTAAPPTTTLFGGGSVPQLTTRGGGFSTFAAPSMAPSGGLFGAGGAVNNVGGGGYGGPAASISLFSGNAAMPTLPSPGGAGWSVAPRAQPASGRQLHTL